MGGGELVDMQLMLGVSFLGGCLLTPVGSEKSCFFVAETSMYLLDQLVSWELMMGWRK
jgi:hypothetical protein